MIPTQNEAEAPLELQPQPEMALLDQIVESAATNHANEIGRLQVESQSLEVEERRLQYFERLAKVWEKSGKIPTSREGGDVAATMVLQMEIGHSLGIPPAQSVQQVYLIKGTPSVSAHLKAEKMRRAGYWWNFIQHDETVCHLELFKQGRKVGEVKYTIEDARRALLVKDDKDASNWVKTPKNMLFARAISNAQRWYAPETQGAGMPATEEINLDDVLGATASRIESATNAKAAALTERLADKQQTGKLKLEAATA